ncbi:hypothetical protein D9M68_502890 [compost metagenome]
MVVTTFCNGTSWPSLAPESTRSTGTPSSTSAPDSVGADESRIGAEYSESEARTEPGPAMRLLCERKWMRQPPTSMTSLSWSACFWTASALT